VWQTDGQTDRQTELRSQRPCNAERPTVKIGSYCSVFSSSWVSDDDPLTHFYLCVVCFGAARCMGCCPNTRNSSANAAPCCMGVAAGATHRLRRRSDATQLSMHTSGERHEVISSDNFYRPNQILKKTLFRIVSQQRCRDLRLMVIIILTISERRPTCIIKTPYYQVSPVIIIMLSYHCKLWASLTGITAFTAIWGVAFLHVLWMFVNNNLWVIASAVWTQFTTSSRRVRSHRRRDSTRQLRRVGGMYRAYAYFVCLSVDATVRAATRVRTVQTT